jgi:AcrR family transcriptional regulator
MSTHSVRADRDPGPTGRRRRAGAARQGPGQGDHQGDRQGGRLRRGPLYLYFADKLDLVRAVHEKLLPAFIEVVRHLPERAGAGTVAGKLTELARSAIRLYRDVLPLGSSLFADPELLRRFRVLLADRGGGPHRAWEPVVAYLRAEQSLGRVAAGADPAAAALLLLGACQQLVFVELMTGPETLPFRDRPDPAGELVATLLTGLCPAPTEMEQRP